MTKLTYAYLACVFGFLGAPAQSMETIKEFSVPGSGGPGKFLSVRNTSDSETQEMFKESIKALINFHKWDIEQGNDTPEESEVKKYDYHVLENRTQQMPGEFDKGDLFLTVVQHNDKLLAGCFYTLIDAKETVLTRGMWFDRSAPKPLVGTVIQNMVSYLTSKAYFPESRKVVVMMRKTSKELPLMTQLGFMIDADFQIPHDNPENYIAYKKGIVESVS